MKEGKGLLLIGGREFLRKASRSIFKLTRLGLKNGPHVTRYFMYRHLAALRIEPPGDARALSISGSHWLCRILGFSERIENVHYPKVNILHLPFADKEFDCVASDQVLEHVEGNPLLAVDECFRILKPGGIAVHTTCFINPIHSFPSDFWRFTPDALALLVQPHADVIDGGGWATDGCGCTTRSAFDLNRFRTRAGIHFTGLQPTTIQTGRL